MMKKIFFIVILALIFSVAGADAYDFRQAMAEGKTFEQIKEEATAFYEERGITADTPKNQRMGYKQYKRWEWFWESRLMEDGSFPPTGFYYQEMLNYNEQQQAQGNGKKKMQLQASFDPPWDFLGPTTAPGGYEGIGRINTIKEDPGYDGNTNQTLWAGSASGGLWKSTDDGSTWSHMTADLGTLGIGDIEFTTSGSTTTIWVATGDGDAGDAYSLGVIKSTDGGVNWSTTGLSFGLSNKYICRAILIDPNSNLKMLVATNGGIYRTTDGGTNWSRTFTTSTYDIEFNPGNSNIVYASTQSSIYKSTDNGANWTHKTSGLPSSSYRVALAVAPSSSNLVYAEYTSTSHAGHVGFYKSTDSGENWSRTDNGTFKNLLGWYEGTGSDATGGQSWYDLCVVTNPSNANEVYVGGVNVWKTTDGGSSWTPVSNWAGYYGYPEVHADHHDLYMPESGRLYSGNDGGVDRTTNGGTSWSYLGSGIECTQFYRLGISQNDTSLVICGAQDNSSFLKNGSTFGMTLATGDGFEGFIDYTNDNMMVTSSYRGNWRYSTNKGLSWNTGPLPTSNPGQWLTPYIQHPSHSDTIYFGFNAGVYIFDANNPTVITYKGNPNTSTCDNLFISKSAPLNMWAGSKYSIKKSSDGGANWSTFSLHASATPVSYMAIHPTDPNTIWTTRSDFSSGNKVFLTTDGGSNWTNVSGTLPNVPCNTVCYVPLTGGTSNYRIFVGMDTGVWYRDENDTDWTQLDDGLPAVVVTELEYQSATETLFASTYGRGLWKLDFNAGTSAVIPDAPVLAKPFNNATDLVAPIDFSWSTATNAVKFSMELAEDTGFTSNRQRFDNIMNIKKQVSGLSDNTVYYWRVKSFSSTGDSSAWTSTWKFTTGSCSPAFADIDITLHLYALHNGIDHRKTAVMVELHSQASTIDSSDLAAYKFPAMIGTNGKIELEAEGITDGDYYIVVRTTGYYPLATKTARTVKIGETTTVTTTTPSDFYAGSDIFTNVSGDYQLKAGDINYDLMINADDANYIPKNNNKNAANDVPKP
jgi:photosystem II stability/assembly factor-like uncharacterized protein